MGKEREKKRVSRPIVSQTGSLNRLISILDYISRLRLLHFRGLDFYIFISLCIDLFM